MDPKTCSIIGIVMLCVWSAIAYFVRGTWVPVAKEVRRNTNFVWVGIVVWFSAFYLLLALTFVDQIIGSNLGLADYAYPLGLVQTIVLSFVIAMVGIRILMDKINLKQNIEEKRRIDTIILFAAFFMASGFLLKLMHVRQIGG